MSQSEILFTGAAVDVHLSGNTADIQVDQASTVAVDINLLTLVGGASPSVTFSINRKSPTGDYEPLGSGTALSAVGKQALDAGPGTAFNHVLDDIIQVSWVTAGAPTGATANITVEGRV